MLYSVTIENFRQSYCKINCQLGKVLKKMTKNKKITAAVISIVIVIAAVAGIIGIVIHQQNTRLNALMAEVATINEITGEEYIANIDREELNEMLERRVSSGKYGEVENAYKNYMTDLYQIVFDAADVSADEAFVNFLSPGNLTDDGPAFENSKDKANELITRLETDKKNYLEMTGSSAIESYAERAGLSGKYKEMYNNILSAHKAIGESGSDDLTTAIDSTVTRLTTINDVFDFLEENQNDWYINDEKLTFRTESLYSEYESFMENL